jgi:hypothetical protein
MNTLEKAFWALASMAIIYFVILLCIMWKENCKKE